MKLWNSHPRSTWTWPAPASAMPVLRHRLPPRAGSRGRAPQHGGSAPSLADVTIVLVTSQQRALPASLGQALRFNGGGDNASDDGTAGPWPVPAAGAVHRQPRNLGFSAANNRALERVVTPTRCCSIRIAGSTKPARWP